MNIIHYFNPGHEHSVIHPEPSYTLPSNIARMGKELAALPLWYALPHEYVLVGDSFDRSYYDSLRQKKITLSRLMMKNELKEIGNARFCMWGISPMGIRFVENINKVYNQNFVPPLWNNNFVYMTGRMMARDVLSYLISNSSFFDFIQLPSFYADLESIENKLLQEGGKSFLVKAPFSSSGRGLIWLPPGEIKRSERQILQGMLNKQKTVSLEPIYDKVLDFAMEFMSKGDGCISFEGYSLFSTDEKGAYSANVLKSQAKIEMEIFNYIPQNIIEETKQLLLEKLAETFGSIYAGCVGIDMMVIRVDGKYRLHPCVEINMRYNMGYLSTKLFDSFVDADSEGLFFVDYDQQETYNKHQRMQTEYPLIVENGKIRSGYLSLCPVNENTKYRAYILLKK